jgi:hypothetical protein
MNKEPKDHLKIGTNKQTHLILEYIKNRGNVEPMKETTKFIKRKPKVGVWADDRDVPEPQSIYKPNKQKETEIVQKLEMG